MADTDALLYEWLTPSFGYVLDGTQVLADTQSPYQKIQVINTATFGNVLRIDGALQCSEKDEFFYHEPLVHMPMSRLSGTVKALVIGGGDGGSLEELLKWPQVDSVDHVEIDPMVVELSQQYLHSVHKGALGGNGLRCRTHIGDGLAWIDAACARGDTYDLIILDLTDAGGPSAPLYAPHFYEQCALALTPTGWMSLHLAAPWAQTQVCVTLVERLQTFFRKVQPFVVSVPVSGGQWLMAACGHEQSADLPAFDELVARLNTLEGAPLQAVNAQILSGMLTLPPYLSNALPQAARRPNAAAMSR